VPLRRHRRDALASSCLQTSDDGDVRVVISGTLDAAGAAAVANDVRWAARRSRGALTIDLTKGGFVDSSGLRLLIEAQQTAAARHIRFRLYPSMPLQQLLEMTGLTEMTSTESGLPLGA
jgi:anti-anti-sigma factor